MFSLQIDYSKLIIFANEKTEAKEGAWPECKSTFSFMSETGRCQNALCTLQKSYLAFSAPCQLSFTTRFLSWTKTGQGDIRVALKLVCLVGSGAVIMWCRRGLCSSVPPPGDVAAGCVGQLQSVWVMPPEMPSLRALIKLVPSAPSIWEVLPAAEGTVELPCSLGCWRVAGPGAIR